MLVCVCAFLCHYLVMVICRFCLKEYVRVHLRWPDVIYPLIFFFCAIIACLNVCAKYDSSMNACSCLLFEQVESRRLFHLCDSRIDECLACNTLQHAV